MKNGFPTSAPHAGRSVIRLLGCVVLALAAVALLSGCSDDENTDVTQVPYPEPGVGPWLNALWGSGPNDVYAVGQPGVILHWDGTAWSLTEVASDILTDVWGTGPGEVYAVGHEGAVLRGSGSNWASMDSGTEENLYGIGRGPYDTIYAVGEKGTIRRLQGNAWHGSEILAYRYTALDVPEDTLVVNEDLQSLTTVNTYALGGDAATVLMENDKEGYDHHWLWGGVEDQARGFILCGTNGPDIEDHYLGNDDGRVLKLVDDPLDGLTWLKLTDPNQYEALPTTFPVPITDLWLDEAGDRLLLTTRNGRIADLQRDGTGSALLYDRVGWLSAIWGDGNGLIWACGKDGLVLHSDDDGATWTEQDVPLPDISTKNIHLDQFGRPLS